MYYAKFKDLKIIKYLKAEKFGTFYIAHKMVQHS